MSLREEGRMVVQGGARAVQGMRSIKDTAGASSSQRVRRLSGALDSSSNLKPGVSAGEEKRKRAEESLRTVMSLSCWAPN